jgi:hypothetical protein
MFANAFKFMICVFALSVSLSNTASAVINREIDVKKFALVDAWIEVWQPANPVLFRDAGWALGQVQGDKIALTDENGLFMTDFFMPGGWIPVTELQTTKWRRAPPPKTNKE